MDPQELLAAAKDKLHRLLTWIVTVDPDELRKDVARARASSSEAEREELARIVFSSARWTATASGAAAGLPATVVSMIPAALADAALLYRAQAKAAGRVALLYDAGFFDESEAGWELLVPMFGEGTASEFLSAAGVVTDAGMSRPLIRKHLSGHTLETFQRVMLKRFALKVTQKMLFTKTVPVVGAAIGGSWNFAEVTVVRERVIRYFARRD